MYQGLILTIILANHKVSDLKKQVLIGKLTLVFEFVNIFVKVVDTKTEEFDLSDDSVKCFLI